MATQTLSVRLPLEIRQALEEAAHQERLAGPSALASAILTRWAHARTAQRTADGIDRAVSYLKAHPDGWDDDPGDFFPQAREL